MTRVDELVTDLKLLISEHYALEMEIEENARLKAEIENIKTKIRQQQWYLGVDSANQVIEIIDKHINHKAESEVINVAEIELVIKIPKKVYKAICDKNALGCDIGDIKNIILNGTPLPKGHGRLIDADSVSADVLKAQDIKSDKRFDILLEQIVKLAKIPTVIEADTDVQTAWSDNDLNYNIEDAKFI